MPRRSSRLSPQEWRDCLLPGILGTLFLAGYPVPWLHEAAHALAAGLLHASAPIRIEVVPFVGGATHLGAAALGEWGRELGAEVTRLVIASAGPAGDVLLSLTLMAVGYRLRWLAPAAGRAMMGMSMGVMVFPITYALGTLVRTPGPRHDFAAIEALTGVPAWLLALGMACLLPLEYRLLTVLRRR